MLVLRIRIRIAKGKTRGVVGMEVYVNEQSSVEKRCGMLCCQFTYVGNVDTVDIRI